MVVGISGASGAILGIRLLEVLKEIEVESHLIISSAARITAQQETDWSIQNIENLASFVYDPGDTAAAIASGSFIDSWDGYYPLFDQDAFSRSKLLYL